MFTDRTGRRITLDEWMLLRANRPYDHVEATRLTYRRGRRRYVVFVSTVWMGIHDENDGRLVFESRFETMVFVQNGELPELDGRQFRHPSEEFARRIHALVVENVRAHIPHTLRELAPQRRTKVRRPAQPKGRGPARTKVPPRAARSGTARHQSRQAGAAVA